MLVSLIKWIFAFSLTVSIFPQSAEAHSWLHCADYRGDVSTFQPDKCYAFPRDYLRYNKGKNVSGAGWFYTLGRNSNACFKTQKTNNPLETAVFEQGQIYCNTWLPANHVAASGRGPKGQQFGTFWPDTGMRVYASPKGIMNPTQEEFNRHPLLTNFGIHQNGKIDCLGFQRVPQFAKDPEYAVASGCFFVDLPPGDYVFQWFWMFGRPSDQYRFCYDVKVTPNSGKPPSIPVTGTDNLVDTLGAGGKTCQQNWKRENEKFLEEIRKRSGKPADSSARRYDITSNERYEDQYFNANLENESNQQKSYDSDNFEDNNEYFNRKSFSSRNRFSNILKEIREIEEIVDELAA